MTDGVSGDRRGADQDDTGLGTITDATSRTNRSVLAGRISRCYGTIVHTTGGTDSRHYLAGGAYETEGRQVSCNILVRRDGEIYIIADLAQSTYHAGKARWPRESRITTDLNLHYIGIEVEASHDPLQLCTVEQYKAAACVHRAASDLYSFPLDHALGHYQVAAPIGRRTDPLGWAWGAFFKHVYMPDLSMYTIEKELKSWQRQADHKRMGLRE